MARPGHGARSPAFCPLPLCERVLTGVTAFMTTRTQTPTEVTEQYDPHVHDTRPRGWQGRDAPDRLVKTHCCFCGVQCGIQLKVKDNVVIGFEPWEEFPVNRGMLCPKGVKRYT